MLGAVDDSLALCGCPLQYIPLLGLQALGLFLCLFGQGKCLRAHNIGLLTGLLCFLAVFF